MVMASCVAVLFGDKIRSQSKPFLYLFQLVAAKDPEHESPPRPTSMTSISWVICCMERSNLSQPMPATKAPQREELAEVDVDWLIAERPGKNLKQHPRKNKTAINIEYMKASIRAKEHRVCIIKRQFGFVKSQEGVAENDNQLAILFTLANLFRADQMIRQWGEISLKLGITRLKWRRNGLNRLIKAFTGEKIGSN